MYFLLFFTPEITGFVLSIQKDEDFYYRNSDFVIENNGNIELIKNSLERILKEIS